MELNTGSRQKMTPTWEAVVYWRATDWIRKAAPVQNRESTRTEAQTAGVRGRSGPSRKTLRTSIPRPVTSC